MIVNGVQLPDPDTADVLFMEKLEREQDIVTKAASNHAVKTRAQIIRSQCEAIFKFFDNVFGEGTAKTIFGEKVNLILCVESYEQALTEIDRLDVEQAAALRAKYVSKYPKTNGKKKKSKKKRYNNYKPKLQVKK